MDTLHGGGLENKSTDDDDQHQANRNRGREQAVLTKLTNHKSLQVDEPQAHEKHRGHERRQQSTRGAITGDGQRCQTEDGEISSSANGCERESCNHCVTTAEYFRTTRDDGAPN